MADEWPLQTSFTSIQKPDFSRVSESRVTNIEASMP